MYESLSVIAVFAVLYAVLHLLFRVSTEAICLLTIVVSWLLLAPFHPIFWAFEIGSLLAGALFGLRVVPAQALAGLGYPPWAAADHTRFDAIARRIGAGEFQHSWIRRGPLDMDQSMHLSTMRLYNHCVFWAIVSTCGHVFFVRVLPGPIACIQILLTSIPVGFVFKRWLARRNGAVS